MGIFASKGNYRAKALVTVLELGETREVPNPMPKPGTLLKAHDRGGDVRLYRVDARGSFWARGVEATKLEIALAPWIPLFRRRPKGKYLPNDCQRKGHK